MVQEIVLSANSAPGFSVMESDDEVEGRILTTAELIERLRERGDIFALDREHRLMTSEVVSLLCAVVFGLWISRMETVMIYDGSTANLTPVAATGTIRTDPVKVPDKEVSAPPPRDIKISKTELHTPKHTSGRPVSAAQSGGAGDPHSRVAKIGLIGIVNGHIRGKSVQGDISSMGGFSEGIDALLAGVGGLKKGSGGTITRKGERGIGFGPGYNRSGFGGDWSSGVDDLIGSSADLTLNKAIVDRTHRVLNINTDSHPVFAGGRSKAEVLRVVMQNLQSLRYAYNKRLRDKPLLNGKIVCKFAIDEFGKVIGCDLVESTIDDHDFEATVQGMIQRWRFDKIDKPGDITEIVYPFVFSS